MLAYPAILADIASTSDITFSCQERALQMLRKLIVLNVKCISAQAKDGMDNKCKGQYSHRESIKFGIDNG